MWPFTRRRKPRGDGGTPPPTPAAADRPERVGPAGLPPLQRVLEPMAAADLTAKQESFSQDLPAWQNPARTHEPLGHEVRADAPAGRVEGIARAGPPLARTADVALPVVQRQARRSRPAPRTSVMVSAAAVANPPARHAPVVAPADSGEPAVVVAPDQRHPDPDETTPVVAGSEDGTPPPSAGPPPPPAGEAGAAPTPVTPPPVTPTLDPLRPVSAPDNRPAVQRAPASDAPALPLASPPADAHPRRLGLGPPLSSHPASPPGGLAAPPGRPPSPSATVQRSSSTDAGGDVRPTPPSSDAKAAGAAAAGELPVRPSPPARAGGETGAPPDAATPSEQEPPAATPSEQEALAAGPGVQEAPAAAPVEPEAATPPPPGDGAPRAGTSPVADAATLPDREQPAGDGPAPYAALIGERSLGGPTADPPAEASPETPSGVPSETGGLPLRSSPGEGPGTSPPVVQRRAAAEQTPRPSDGHDRPAAGQPPDDGPPSGAEGRSAAGGRPGALPAQAPLLTERAPLRPVAEPPVEAGGSPRTGTQAAGEEPAGRRPATGAPPVRPPSPFPEGARPSRSTALPVVQRRSDERPRADGKGSPPAAVGESVSPPVPADAVPPARAHAEEALPPAATQTEEAVPPAAAQAEEAVPPAATQAEDAVPPAAQAERTGLVGDGPPLVAPGSQPSGVPLPEGTAAHGLGAPPLPLPPLPAEQPLPPPPVPASHTSAAASPAGGRPVQRARDGHHGSRVPPASPAPFGRSAPTSPLLGSLPLTLQRAPADRSPDHPAPAAGPGRSPMRSAGAAGAALGAVPQAGWTSAGPSDVGSLPSAAPLQLSSVAARDLPGAPGTHANGRAPAGMPLVQRTNGASPPGVTALLSAGAAAPGLEATTVQRAPSHAPATDAPETVRSDGSEPGEDAGSAPDASVMDQLNLDELTRRLGDRLVHRIKRELRLDRDRAGQLTDLRR